MDDVPISKIQISGPTLASLLHRFSSSQGSLHGLLFGHVIVSTTTPLSDDPISTSATTAAAGPLFTATITSFISLPSNLPLPLNPLPNTPSSSLLGWFSGRRRTPLRPSLSESTTTHTLSSSTTFSQNVVVAVADYDYGQAGQNNLTLPASLFLLLTTPFQDQLIHTLEYKAYQYRISNNDSFEPRSLDIINIGPSFRSQYESFSPNSLFPITPCEFRGSNAMAEDEEVIKEDDDHKEMNLCDTEGFEFDSFSKLMGSDAANYTGELENLYDKMLAKLDGLARSVEKSSAKVLEQENHNMKLRLKVAGLE